jgi:hypothetical protein
MSINATNDSKPREEYWINIEGYEGLYQISNYGRVKSLSNNKERKEKILRSKFNSCKYVLIELSKNNIRHMFLVHRLVAKYFINNPENKPDVNHKNGIKTDNNVDNLEWCTQSENELHAYRTRLKIHSKGKEWHTAKLTQKKVDEIRYIYSQGNTSYIKLGLKFNVVPSNIAHIIKNRRWI